MARFHHCSGRGEPQAPGLRSRDGSRVAGAQEWDGLALATARRCKLALLGIGPPGVARRLGWACGVAAFPISSSVCDRRAAWRSCASLGEVLVGGLGGGCLVSGLPRIHGGVEHAAAFRR